MDPASRRFLWNTLSSILVGGRSIVLTSHRLLCFNFVELNKKRNLGGVGQYNSLFCAFDEE